MKEKIVVITGGSSGLGLCIAKRLVIAGRNVFIIGRESKKLEDALKGIRLLNPEIVVKGHSMDISHESEVNQFYDELSRNYEVECLFNVAGVGIFGKAKDILEEEIDEVINSNLKGLILMTSGVLKHMESYGGKIANVISTAGLRGKSDETLYCASKWGARGYTEALKAEYDDGKILFYGIYPGGMKTEFWDRTPSFNTENFMNPEHVANQIIDIVLNESLYTSDIVIEPY